MITLDRTHRAAVITPIALVITALLTSSAISVAESSDDSGATYFCDTLLYSCKPGNEAATYVEYMRGGVGPTGTNGSGIYNSQHKCGVEVTGKLLHRRFVLLLKVAPEKEDKQTHARQDEFDLTDLMPKSIELARDDDGRVYRLSLLPRVQLPELPEQFDIRKLELEDWSFPESPVIVNDQNYVGQLSMSHGPLCWFDVPGVARVEFSLLHLKGGTATGTLADGVINLTGPDGTTVRISNVKNGVHQQTLGGGPYTVWVKWGKSSKTREEFRKMSLDMITELKEKAKHGDLSIRPEVLEQWLKKTQGGQLQMMECGLRQVDPDELVKPAVKH